MSKQDSLASCLAKMYESKFEHVAESGKPKGKTSGGTTSMDKKLNLLNEKVDKILHIQEDVLGRLEMVHHGMDILEREMDKLMVFQFPSLINVPEKDLNPGDYLPQSQGHGVCSEIIRLLKSVHEDTTVHREKLDSMEKMVSTMDKVVAFLGKTFRNSKVLDFILKGTSPWKKEALDEAKDKSEEKEIKKTKHGPSSRTATAEGQRLAADSINSNVLEDLNLTVQKTHCEGSTHNKLESSPHAEDQIHPLETSKPVDKAEAPKTCSHKITGDRTGDAHTAPYVQHSQTTTNKGTEPKTEEKLRETSVTTVAQSHPDTASPTICSVQVSTQASQGRNTEDGTSGHGQSQDSVKHKPVFHEVKGDIKSGKAQIPWQKNTKCTKSQESCETAPGTQLKLSETDTKERVEDIKTTREEGSVVPHKEGETVIKESCPSQTQDQPQGATLPDGSEPGTSSENVIDDCPPPPAPFSHRIVSIKQAILSSCYTVCQHELLGGGRFGQVHKCVEKSSGLRLAAKIIKVKGSKDRDEVKNEINVMNQLNHVNLIQLYDAFECRNDLTLIMEYLDGGELFDRITDENYNLTELDAIMFTRQICEGIYYLHQQYILHLDLKPENILCVSRTGNQIKIIDFGLARRYKPREKLKVNFGTPEFLAPEVVNYDFVSFPTDMWSIGVITYMLLSGLSPFLGESDAETMNYIVNCNWDFDSEAFDEVSEEAKDFVSKLMVKEKSGRLSAGQCLKHEWLVNLPLRAKKYKIRLKSQILLQRYLMQRKWKKMNFAIHREDIEQELLRAESQWKHFYVVAAANRLRKFHLLALKPS